MYEQNFENEELQCVECGVTFEFSAEDQEFYAKKGYSTPKRCAVCRDARKARAGGGGRSGGGARGGRDRGERQQFPVTCAACGCETTVPFKPSNDRPVFCLDCYKKGQ